MNSETRNQKRETFTGTVKTFITRKGYGFIEIGGTAQAGEKDLFVHVSAVRGAGSKFLEPGDQVSFEIGSSRDGRPAAVNVIRQLSGHSALSTQNSSLKI